MICQNRQIAKATYHVTERLPSGGYQESHFCGACGRLKLSDNRSDVSTCKQLSGNPEIRLNKQRAAFCGWCKKEVTGRELCCPHCSQSFADCVRCHACHSTFLRPLDSILWSRIRKTGTGFRDAVLQGFVCQDCGYAWHPQPAK